MKRRHLLARLAAALPIFLSLSSPLQAHEAWLLTPAEIEELSRAPVPALFRSSLWLGFAAAVGFVLTLVALRLEPLVFKLENQTIFPFWTQYGGIGPLALRLGLAVMMVLGAFGGLPRHGVEVWTIPTFLVPDMHLTSIAGADGLIAAQLVLAGLLIGGLAVRVCGAAVVAMSCICLVIFGPAFGSYAPHFVAPGLILITTGAGRFSCDYAFKLDVGEELIAPYRQVLWRSSHILIGAGFVYLGVAYKLIQPTLLIAILEHGSMPTFGLPMAVIALVMTGVEILCGALLVTGRLVRPVALAILGAITFLAIVLGETPLFHANLYGALFVLFLAGPTLPSTHVPARMHWVRAE